MSKFLIIVVSMVLCACATTKETPDISQWQEYKSGYFHPLSGLVCPDRLREFRFEEVSVNPSYSPGLDIHCKLRDANGNWVTLFLNHDSTRATLKDHFEEASNSIRLVHSTDEVRPVPKTSDGNEVAELAAAYRMTPYTMRLLVDEEVMDTAIWLKQIGSWHVKIRANYFRGYEERVANLGVAMFEKSKSELPKGHIYFGPTTPASAVVIPAE